MLLKTYSAIFEWTMHHLLSWTFKITEPTTRNKLNLNQTKSCFKACLSACVVCYFLCCAAACSDSDNGGHINTTNDATNTTQSDTGSKTDATNGDTSTSTTEDGNTSGDANTNIPSDVPMTIPTIRSNIPMNGATAVAINGHVEVTFSELMDANTLNTSSFVLTSGDPPVAVLGTIIYTDLTAAFWPSAHLAADTEYVATVTTDARSAAGVPIEADHAWRFTTGQLSVPGLPVNLGMAADFAILAKSGISSVPASTITGDIGVSPAAATFITGFSLSADATNVFSTSPQVTGRVYAADFAPPTPSNMTTTISDMELAFTDAAGRAPDVIELGAGNIGGMTLSAGVYKWGTGLLIPTDVTLSGSATDVWIFQIAQDLTVSSGARIVLAGGALPENIFWQVAGFVELGTTAHGEGAFLCQTAITMRTGASVNGRLLSQTAVTLDSAVVVEPAE